MPLVLDRKLVACQSLISRSDSIRNLFIFELFNSTLVALIPRAEEVFLDQIDS